MLNMYLIMPKTAYKKVEIRNLVLQRVGDGEHPAEVANSLNVSLGTVRNILKECGVEVVLPNSGRYNLYMIIAMLIKKINGQEIANTFGVSRQYINKIKHRCKEAGIPI